MKVLVDTSIWSEVLRRNAINHDIARNLEDLIKDTRVFIIGPIRQELLSGISNLAQFNKVKNTLSFFSDISLTTKHFINAAEFSNKCRKKGVQGSTTDFLICSVSYLENTLIYTKDLDFKNFKKHLPINLV